MVAATFQNKNFEAAGAGDTPLVVDPWEGSFAQTGTDIAGWGEGPTEQPWDDFETQHAGEKHTILLSRVEYFPLVNGTTILLSFNGGAGQLVTFLTGDFVSIGQATAAEVAAVIDNDTVNIVATADADGRVRLEGASQYDTVEVIGPVTDANDVLGFPYVRTEPRVLVSEQEPFALVDGSTLSVLAGTTLERALFQTADFVDIAAATADEVKAVLDVDMAPGISCSVVLGRLMLQSGVFGQPLAIVGFPGQSTANEVLGFPRVVHAFDEGGVGIGRVPWSGGLLSEGFEQAHAGLAALNYTSLKAPFAVSNGDTLDVEINMQPAQQVVFGGIAIADAATAFEIADNLNALNLGSPPATAFALDDIEVVLFSDFVGPGSGIRISGGTALAALGFTPAVGYFVPGNEAYTTVLPSSTAASFGPVTDIDPFEDFEEGYGAPDLTAFMWVFTLDRIRISHVVEGATFTLTLGTETFARVASAADTATSMASSFAAMINNVDNGSDLMSATSALGVITLTRLDTRIKVEPILFVVTGDSTGDVGTTSTAATIDAAAFDTAPEDFEDFEEDWSNNAWTWVFTVDSFAVLVATAGELYELFYGPEYDRRSVSYTAIGGDTLTTIATALRTSLTFDPDVAVGAVAAGVFTVEGVGAYHINPQGTSDNGLTEWRTATLDAAIDAAEFGTTAANNDFESFNFTIDYQMELDLSAADPQPAGVYSFKLNGVPISYTSPGAENEADIAAEWVSAIATSIIKNSAEGAVVSGRLRIRSQSIPRTTLGVSDLTAPVGTTLTAAPVDTTKVFDNLGHMCSI